jgi:hypothetical protein
MPLTDDVGTTYQQPDAFRLLDDFVNGDPELVESFHQGLVDVAAGSGPGNYGPFENDNDMQTHWGRDWTNEGGSGGTFWPYLSDINIFDMLTAALTTSVGIALESGKQHTTIWLPHTEGPPSGNGAGMSFDEQRRLFTTAVHETSGSVQLVIITPRPIATSG